MIIVKDLHKTFENNRVLRGVNYHVHQGEKIVVIGPSGSGKSTFLRCLNLLEVPTSGEIWFDGINITDQKTDIDKVREHMGMVFQNFNLFNNLTIMQNITLKIKSDGKRRSRRECVEASGKGWIEGKGRCLSKSIIRRAETACGYCAVAGHEPAGDAF